MWNAETLEASTDVLFVSPLTIVAALQQEILGLCALWFRQWHFSSSVLLHWSRPNRSGIRKFNCCHGKPVCQKSKNQLAATFQCLESPHYSCIKTPFRTTQCNKLASLWQCFVYWPPDFTKNNTLEGLQCLLVLLHDSQCTQTDCFHQGHKNSPAKQ